MGTFVNINTASPHAGESAVVAALLTAVSYNLLNCLLGYPSSSSNSLAGGLVDAGLFAVGAGQINWGVAALHSGELQGFTEVIAGLFASPLLGFIIGFFTMKVIFRIFRRFTEKISRLFIAS